MNLLKNSVSYVFVFLMLCVPLGPSVKSIGLVLTLISLFFLPQFKTDFKIIFWHPLTLAIGFFLLFALFSSLWSVASPSQEFSMFEKHMKLLFIPFIAAGFTSPKIRNWAMHAFLIAMGITCVISLYQFIMFHAEENFDFGKVIYNHIVTGYMMSFATYLTALLRIHTKKSALKWLYGLIIIIFSVQILVINMSRTGYMIYFILFTLLLLQHFSLKKSLQYGLIGICMCLLLGILMLHSQNFLNGMQMLAKDIQLYTQGIHNTSVGFRLQFHHYAEHLFWNHPLIGQGIGGFTANFFVDNPIPLWLERNPDPHSQYWLIACELGVIGLLSFISIFIFLFRLSFQLHEMKFVLQGLLISILLGSFSDTLLVNSGIGYLFVCFVGLSLGEYIQLQNSKRTLEPSKYIDSEPIPE